MAVDNWFQTWHPPFAHQALQEPIKNISSHHDFYSRNKSPSLTNIVPFILSFHLLQPKDTELSRNPKKYDTIFRPGELGKTTYSYENANFHNVEHELDFRFPNEISPGESPLGFPDPFESHEKKNMNRTYEEEHNLKPLERTGHFKTWYRWKLLDLSYPSEVEKRKAIVRRDFIPENNLPLGIEVYKNRIFMSLPKWKPGVPVTLVQLPRVPKEESPALVPYPNWDWHSEKSCDSIASVFRMQADSCGRLWVLDSGKKLISLGGGTQHCLPKLLIFDLESDQLLEKYIFEKEFVKENGLYSNIVVDIRDGDCDDAYAYMSDVWRFGIVVFRLADLTAWHVTSHLFYPDPLAAYYRLHELKFQWMDGIFGIALSPEGGLNEDRLLYFHSMSGFREFSVKTSYLRKEYIEDEDDAYKILGQSRGPQGHVSSSVVDENGIMYYNLVTRDSIGCWDTRKPYKRENLGVIAKSKRTLVFPNDIRLDQSKKQSMWIITNRLPFYLIEGLNPNTINFRVMSAYTEDSIKDTICDPKVHYDTTYIEYEGDIDCY